VTGRRMHVWDGECHVHAGIRPRDIADVRAAHPDAEFMIHPECGCTTQVMEYVASGDVDRDHTHMLSTGGMLDFARASAAETFIVATETGMLHPLRKENPEKSFVPANRAAACRYMKMITLPKLHRTLRDLKPEVKVDPAVAERARVPIDRMVAIG
jgi:quinolinate synthase